MDPSTRRFTTWADLRAHLAAAHAVTDAGDDALQATVAGAVLEVRRVDHGGRAWIEILAMLEHDLRDVPPTSVLVKNFTLAVGALGIASGSLVLRQLLPLDGLRAVDLDEVVTEAARVVAESR